MKSHEFTIIASGLHPETHDLANLFYDAGCDDASISFQKGVIIAEFEREAVSFSNALISACQDVMKTGARVDRFEPDYLVSLTDIATRAELSKSAISLYHKGERGEGFPSPVARVTTDSPLWDWCEVTMWMYARKQITHEVMVSARVVREANLALKVHDFTHDHFVERLTAVLEQVRT